MMKCMYSVCIVSIKSSESKDDRVKVHHFIKSTFANLNSNGVERDGKKYIRVTYLARKGLYIA